MTKIWCCICSRRTDKSEERKRIGLPSVWSMVRIHASKIGLDMTSFSTEDHICLKCYATVSHYRMTDRGPDKIIKIFESVAFEPIITKAVLRGFTTPSITSDVAVVSSITRKFNSS